MTYVRAKITKKKDEVQQTERNFKEMSSMESIAQVPKTCTSALVTMCKRKLPVRPVVLRKPLSSHSTATTATAPASNHDTKKRNEVFKIWNDNNDEQKNPVKQNTATFFHSYMTLEPKETENNECIKAQERLEKVKKEFSKMVNITEDLLKKSNANKLQLGPAPKISLEGVKLGASGGSKDSKTVTKFNNPKADNSTKDIICDDYKNNISTSPKDCGNEEVRCSNSSDRKENNTEYKITSAVKQLVINNKPSLIPSGEKITCFAKQNSATYFGQKAKDQNSLPAKESSKKNIFINSTINIKAHVTKTNTNFMKSSQESPVRCGMKENKKNCSTISENGVKNLVKEEQMKDQIAEGRRSPQALTERKTCEIQEPDQIETIHDKKFNTYLHEKDYKMRLIDGELQKRNILLVNNQKQKQSEVIFKSCNMPTKDKELLIGETERRSKNLNKQIVESLSRKFSWPVVIVPEETSGCCSPDGTATTISNGNGTRTKPDLYDKLDSTSATDSTNSFEFHEKKSQVLQICDLTNSLEDLGRLDKICRIIEISDDLSDRLFSCLDQPKPTGLHQKKWSFRDLCERIQLDDFCNNVFGKSRN